jgi:two-component system response regulator
MHTVPQVQPILLVEDDPDDVRLTMRALRLSRIANEVHVAEDGEAALDYLLGRGPHAAAPPPLPHLVLLDLKLPKVDGLGVLKALRADPRTRLLPVVILTSSAEEKDVVAGYAEGANSFIRKPVDFTQFATAIQQLGLYWLVMNVSPPRTLAR